jgi:hypothetical protein
MKKGDRVKLLVHKRPYYSGYAGNPHFLIPDGTIGTVHSVKCANVTRKGTFAAVEFYIPGIYSGNPKHNNCIWMCSCIKGEIRKVSK